MRFLRLRVPGIIRLVVLLLLLGALPAQPAAAEGEGRLHPYLRKLADQSPDKYVTVILGLGSNSGRNNIENLTGSKILRQWSFIEAMSIRVPARTLRRLANDPGVKFVTPNAPVRATARYDVAQLATSYQRTLNAGPFWAANSLGQGVGVAAIDSGIGPHRDLNVARDSVSIQGGSDDSDRYGHGTHVAGIIAGNSASGIYRGLAPRAKLYSVRISDDQGNATESDLLDGLAWVHANHKARNIRVVNVSLQSGNANGYHTSALAAAVEKLWLDGVVVVVSAGNRGTEPGAVWYPPANDPYVITVGAMDDLGTDTLADDRVIDWSSRGVTQDGFAKPEVLAPGRRILSTLAPNSSFAQQYSDRIVDRAYMTLSGSSMAAPAITGAIALMLSHRPSLTPNQVKYLLTRYPSGALAGQEHGAAVVPDLGRIFHELSGPQRIPEANQGLTPSHFGKLPAGTVGFDNIYFENIYFENIYYNNIYFTNIYFGD